MTEQGNLFDAPPVRPSAFTGRDVAHTRNGMPKESYEAAAQVNVTRSKTLLLRAARLKAGTADQLRSTILAAGEKISPSGARTRAKELCDDGLMVVTGRMGKHAVYGLTDRGRVVANHLAAQAHADMERAA